MVQQLLIHRCPISSFGNPTTQDKFTLEHHQIIGEHEND